MDIRDYEYIVAIAEQGNISRAAAQLFITQSALTKFLQRTEKELGLPLFFKKGNQFLLTEVGHQYVDTGRVIMHLDRELSDKLEKERLAHKKLIRLGIGMGRTMEYLEIILPLFRRKYPDVQVFLKADTSRRNVMALQNGQLDMAVLNNVERIPGYYFRPIEKCWLVLAVREDSFLLNKSRQDSGYPYPVIHPSELNGLNFVSLPSNTNSGRMALEICKRYGIQRQVVLEVCDVRSVTDAIECGYGAAILVSSMPVSKQVKYLSLEGIEMPHQEAELVYRSDKTFSRAMEYLRDLILHSQSLKEENNREKII